LLDPIFVHALISAIEREPAHGISFSKPPGIGPMQSYRLYLRSADDAILAREDFWAENDRTALEIAAIIEQACSDLCTCCELWAEKRLVSEGMREVLPVTNRLQLLSVETQERICDLEDTLQRSGWRIAKSQKLLEKQRQLHSILDTPNRIARRP
jgi:hypothetical protein